MQLFRRHEVKHILLKRERGENLPSPCLSRINAYLCLRPKVQKDGPCKSLEKETLLMLPKY